MSWLYFQHGLRKLKDVEWKKVGILKYFKEIYGEKNVKPHKQAFIDAMEKNRPYECAMIGDSLDLDIRAAKNAGIEKVVWKDNFNKKDEYEKI